MAFVMYVGEAGGENLLAEIEYDPEQDVFCGRVELPQGGCNFSGRSLEELREGFKTTRDALLEAVASAA